MRFIIGSVTSDDGFEAGIEQSFSKIIAIFWITLFNKDKRTGSLGKMVKLKDSFGSSAGAGERV
jgi:hypothetical protein